MVDDTDRNAIASALAAIPRHGIPDWLAQTLDLLQANSHRLEPLPEENDDILEHLYPH